MVKIACQTIVFGNEIKDNITKFAETVKHIGYDGIETGARHFYLDKPEFYQELFDSLDLKLITLHVGGDFTNKDSVKQQLDNIKNIVAFSKKLGCYYLYLSGHKKEGKTKDDYIAESESYQEIGKMCNDEGLVLCYHNHDWEFYKDGSEGMNTLLEYVPSEFMKLVPDVGWLEIAGVPSVKFLKDNINRIEALHFKDFKGPGQFAELGNGIVPFKEIYDYAVSLGRDWWITAEQDKTELKPEEAARINFDFINSLGK